MRSRKAFTRYNTGITSIDGERCTSRKWEGGDGSIFGGEGPGDQERHSPGTTLALPALTGEGVPEGTGRVMPVALPALAGKGVPEGTGRGWMAAFLAAKDCAIWSCSNMEKGMKRALKDPQP